MGKALSHNRQQEVIDEIVEYFRQGLKYNDICKKYKFDKKELELLIKQAYQRINEEFKEKKSFVIGLHLQRYESLYQKNRNYVPNPKWRDDQKRNALIDKYVLALDILLAKERLLGIHSRQYNVQLNNYINTGRDDSNKIRKFNLSKLTFTELKLLKKMIVKCRVIIKEDNEFITERNMNQLFSITENIENIEENNTEDIQHEEVEPSPLNKVQHTGVLIDKEIHQRKNKGKTIEDLQKEVEKQNINLFEKKLLKMKKGK